MYIFINSGSARRTLSMVCVVRKPSWIFKNGVREFSAVRRAIESQVLRFLCVARKQHPPAAIGHRHDIVVARMHVERL